MRTPIEALKEIRDRLTFFCLRTDGEYDPPWATELVGIIDEVVTDSNVICNAAAMREALTEIRDTIMNGGFDGRSPAHFVNICDAALSAPSRNCDLNLSSKSLWDKFEDYMHDCGLPFYSEPSGEDAFDWLLAQAEKRKGE